MKMMEMRILIVKLSVVLTLAAMVACSEAPESPILEGSDRAEIPENPGIKPGNNNIGYWPLCWKVESNTNPNAIGVVIDSNNLDLYITVREPGGEVKLSSLFKLKIYLPKVPQLTNSYKGDWYVATSTDKNVTISFDYRIKDNINKVDTIIVDDGYDAYGRIFMTAIAE